ncbi:hypothetical protein G6O69_22290 [Pseudenhygromyxa sp. WMMC2535]|uniref:hypothetical protein n=1 Tax=Pseudenhygromyxa sp. WMMC2535 TaxID=2712867 RepID=UPI00155825B1|nr:hypothetical protein [Pseudenhygromyxa sp. WMMC2535]NVB40587.1 hypothetical protein [Pseudenhygromyxa sp. WMMC2535]
MAEVNSLISPATLQKSMQTRLWAGGRRGTNVVWQDRGSSVAVYPSSLRLRVEAGFVVAAVDLETDQTGREAVEMVFFLGRSDRGDGLVATTTMDGDDPSGLRTRWGEALRAALWDGVLDLVDAQLTSLRKQANKGGSYLAGFHGSEKGLHLTIVEAKS